MWPQHGGDLMSSSVFCTAGQDPSGHIEAGCMDGAVKNLNELLYWSAVSWHLLQAVIRVHMAAISLCKSWRTTRYCETYIRQERQDILHPGT
jgi:hypothetical protein